MQRKGIVFRKRRRVNKQNGSLGRRFESERQEIPGKGEWMGL
jgi:hypothetical protein